VRILIWHVHGSWTTAFLQGGHDYLLPVVPDRGADGGGRNPAWDWPANAVERTPEQLRAEDIDGVIVQRERDLQLCEEWTGRRPGRDVPAVWLEHNAPQGRINDLRHPAADHPELTVVHVTHFNDAFWDCGPTRTTVIEHGIVDPGLRYTGELERIAVASNEPVRRARVTGTDLLPRFTDLAPVDVFGMKTEGLAEHLGLPADRLGTLDLPQDRLHDELARRRVYLHPIRWTSLGLSLLEAMHLGMPVAALAATEAVEAVPPGAGVISTDVEVLRRGVRDLLADRDAARAAGAVAREAALSRYGVKRFLADWDRLLDEVTAER
jgi:glycosyltransferase involved in cell wall biosynthesis